MNETFFHLAAYYASLTNGSTNAAVAGVPDSILTRTTANNFILPKPAQLRMLYSAGVSLTQARVNTPSLRLVGLPYTGPVNLTLAVPSPANLSDWGPNAPQIPTADEISIEHTLGGAGPENEFSLVWFHPGLRAVPPGPRYRLLYTATITAATGTWVNGSMSTAQSLPAGSYAVVGMDAVGTNLAAARLIFANGGWRPGCLGRNAVGNIVRPEFTDGSLGIYGIFDSVNTPNLDVFAIGANTAQTIYLDVVRLGNR